MHSCDFGTITFLLRWYFETVANQFSIDPFWCYFSTENRSIRMYVRILSTEMAKNEQI